MEDEIICNNCGWVGDSTMLISKTDELDDPCILCPHCNSDDIDDFE